MEEMTVSGIVTTYKRDAGIVKRAITSMLDQTYPVFEIIVVDDNDNDSDFSYQIKDMVSSFEKQCVKYIKQDGNKGACAARNLGIQNAHGQFVAFLDDDDIWLPEKIEKQLRYFKENDDSLGLVYCTGINRFETTNTESPYFNYSIFQLSVTHDDLLFKDYIGSTSQPLIRRSVFDEVGMFWEEQPARQDYEMWLRISTKYRILGIKESLFIHILSENEQISKSSKKAHRGYINIYQRYKSEYDKKPRARKAITRLIIKTWRGSNLAESCYYFYLWFISKVQCALGGDL